MHKLKRITTRVIALFFALLMFADSMVVNVYAGDTIFLQSLIDVSTFKYQVNPVADTNKKKKKFEFTGSQINQYVFNVCGIKTERDSNLCYRTNGNFNPGPDGIYSIYGSSLEKFWINTELMSDGGKIYVDDNKYQEDRNDTWDKVGTALLESTAFFKNANAANFMPLSWPSGPAMHSATTEEINYASNVSATLSNSLNELVSLVNGEKINDISRLMAVSVALRPTGNKASFGNYTLYYKYDVSGGKSGDADQAVRNHAKAKTKLTNISDIDNIINSLPTYDNDGNLYVYIVPTSSTDPDATVSSISSMIYAMPKGYRTTNGGKYSKNPMFIDGTKPYKELKDDDAAWVNIHMLAQYANSMYKVKGVTSGNVADADEGNWIINFLVNLFQKAVHGVLSWLGLKSTNELVYNRGLRGSSLFNFGTMSENWWKTVLQYHLIFQALAWFIIVCGFLKTCISLNLSRMNPQARETAYDSIKRFLIVGFGLVLIIPLSQFMMSMNNSIVQLFASQVDNVNSDIAPNVKGIAGIIFVFAYAIIRIYINFVYVMRSITIALLLVSAPFFIAFGAWSKGGVGNSLTMNWFKELTANIFMQSVHAFTLAFLIKLMGNGSGLESFVISYSIIPITEMFRNLIFQGAGSSTVSLGQQAADKGTKMAQNFARTAGDGIAGGVGTLLNKGESKSTEGNGGSGNKGGRGSESGIGTLNSAIDSKVAKLRDGGHGATANALKGLQGAGKAVGAIAGFGTGMMNAELSGNSMGYADAGKAAGGAIGGAAMSAAASYVAHEAKENNPLSKGQKSTDENKQALGGDYIPTDDSKKPTIRAEKVNSDSKAALARLKNRGENFDTIDPEKDKGLSTSKLNGMKTGLAMRVAREGIESVKQAENLTDEDVKDMKKVFGFSNEGEAREYLANNGMALHANPGSGYKYSVGNDITGSIQASKFMKETGDTAVQHAIPQSNGAVATAGADNSVNLTFGKTQDGFSGYDNFAAFAKRDSGAAKMFSQISDSVESGNYSGRLANGVQWNYNPTTQDVNLNYGRDFQKLNNIKTMEVSHDGNYINSIVGNRNLSSIYTTNVTSTGLTNGFDNSQMQPKQNPVQN